jgi:hypothetical protein
MVMISFPNRIFDYFAEKYWSNGKIRLFWDFDYFITEAETFQSRNLHNGIAGIMAYFPKKRKRDDNKKFSLLFGGDMIVYRDDILEGSMLLRDPEKERK